MCVWRCVYTDTSIIIPSSPQQLASVAEGSVAEAATGSSRLLTVAAAQICLAAAAAVCTGVQRAGSVIGFFHSRHPACAALIAAV